MRDDLLFLSAHLPVAVSQQAGEKSAYRNLRWLAERYRIHLVTFRGALYRDQSLSDLERCCERVKVIEATSRARLLGLAARPIAPLAVAFRFHRTALETIEQWTAEKAFGRVHAEWSPMVQYLSALRGIGERTLYVHDVLHQWLGRKAVASANPIWRLEARRAASWEARAYQDCTHIFVPSDKDASLLRALPPLSGSRFSVLPLHFDRYTSPARRERGPVLRLLFWGALSRIENVASARWILRSLRPLLQGAGVPVRLTLAGANPPPDLLAEKSAEIEIPGFMADPAPLFRDADLAVLPVFQGAGVKVKVLECLAAGLPVLTTPMGAEGIGATAEDGLLVLDDEPNSFAQQIRRIAAEPELLSRLSRSAAQWGLRQDNDHRALLLDGQRASASAAAQALRDPASSL
jgi:glycosyltransferase involved in cell wall biosynthesis